MYYRNLSRSIKLHRSRLLDPQAPKYYDVFINHRGVDTKQNLASLLYGRLSQLHARPFLDKNTMEPGVHLRQQIDMAIRDCKVGVAVLSPRYGESYYCLHELALMMECKKKVIPIFFDIQPSNVRVLHNGTSDMDLKRFEWALEEAKSTFGLVFDSHKGNWLDVLTAASDAVMSSLSEIESEEPTTMMRI